MYISEQSIVATIRAALEKANLQYSPRYDERAQAEIVLEVNIGDGFKLMPVTKSIKYSEGEGASITIKDYLDMGYLPVSVCSQRKHFWSTKRNRLVMFIREESFNEYEPLTSRLDAILVGI